MVTLNDLPDYNYSHDEYKYQPSLTEKLDKSGEEFFNQDLINEIVLWKINRYAAIDDETLRILNSGEIKSATIDKEFTRHLILRLLGLNGIRLAMASTILRFRNPKVYQIIDQRVFRFIYGQELKLSASTSTGSTNAQIELYFNYLDKLRTISDKTGWDYSQLDRILYALDIKHNKEYSIKY
jgi:hypothetical protein